MTKGRRNIKRTINHPMHLISDGYKGVNDLVCNTHGLLLYPVLLCDGSPSCSVYNIAFDSHVSKGLGLSSWIPWKSLLVIPFPVQLLAFLMRLLFIMKCN